MNHQVYLNKSNNFSQDNQSDVRMELNGRNYCTGKLRHIYIKYFFIKDWVYKEKLSIVYCPTYLMLSDYFKHPLHGALIHKFRYIIMVRVVTFTLIEDTFSYTRKEHVGKNIP